MSHWHYPLLAVAMICATVLSALDVWSGEVAFRAFALVLAGAAYDVSQRRPPPSGGSRSGGVAGPMTILTADLLASAGIDLVS